MCEQRELEDETLNVCAQYVMPLFSFFLTAKFVVGRSKPGNPGHINPEIKGRWVSFFDFRGGIFSSFLVIIVSFCCFMCPLFEVVLSPLEQTTVARSRSSVEVCGTKINNTRTDLSHKGIYFGLTTTST